MSSYERIIQENKIRIGTKQTLRMVEQGKASEVYVAKNADPSIIRRLLQLCEAHEVKVSYVETMKELGKASGIDVGAAMVAIINEQ